MDGQLSPLDLIERAFVPVSRKRSMHVTIVGPVDGPPAVALHGLGGSTDHNLPALRAVAERYGLRIYAIDLPNHGRSAKVRAFQFRARHFADLILEGVRALQIEPVVIVGHSFGGQLAALVAEAMPDSLQPIFINPALGTGWDVKLRGCWRRPWRFFKLIEELGYDDDNVARGELYHAGRLMVSLVDMFRDREIGPFRRLQATLALLLSRDTTAIVNQLTQRGIWPIIIQGMLDQSTPASEGAHLVDGFHSWLHETTGPQALLAALDPVFTVPVSAMTRSSAVER